MYRGSWIHLIETNNVMVDFLQIVILLANKFQLQFRAVGKCIALQKTCNTWSDAL